MRPVLTPDEMAAADAAAVRGGVSVGELMERAGAAVAAAAIRLAGGRYGRSALVVCGKGNNGGDGFVAARRLRREGLRVRCILLAEPGDVRGAAKHHLERMVAAGISPESFAGSLPPADVIVDAIFGTGFHGAPDGAPADAIEQIAARRERVVAVDIPSGVDGLTGASRGVSVRAAVTVAMAAEKLGTATAPGAENAGRVEVADIGIDVTGGAAHVVERHDVAGVLPRRRPSSHKGNAGAVALLAGSDEMTGAALLAARGAGRAGAGYVRLGATAATKTAVAGRLPEVMTRVVGDGVFDAGSWERFGEDAARSDALAIGPGIGRGPGQRDLVLRALAESDIPLVLDADALNNLAGWKGALDIKSPASLLRSRRGDPAVLTPHPGELAELLDTSTAEIQADRVAAARRAAERFGSVILLKGFRTVVSEPSGTVVIDTAGGPALAAAGTGDVLTGVVAALLAAGLGPPEAAWAGAYLHGLAGQLAAVDRGRAGVLATDVADALPAAIHRTRSTAP